ncbi:MAG: coenzyme A pyrophosphatase [Flavobacteriales bacterium]|nr:coenzyme A pyrophosphatase [Flavobacteriales bacterium]
MTASEFINRIQKSNDDFSMAHSMMPWYRKLVKPSAQTLKKANKAAVLVHVFQGQKDLEILYMKRPAYEGTHGGQVSFPGGKRETVDADFEHTAIREAEEEVGLKSSMFQIVKEMSPLYIPPSNFLVYPFVSFAEQKHDLILETKEVAYTFSVPLNMILTGELVDSVKVPTKMGKMKVPAYVWEEEMIWGATAIITARLAALLS